MIYAIRENDEKNYKILNIDSKIKFRHKFRLIMIIPKLAKVFQKIAPIHHQKKGFHSEIFWMKFCIRGAHSAKFPIEN